MRLLVDTHAFVWAATAPEKLSGRSREVLGAADTAWVFSVISAWEIQIKASLAKLDIGDSLKVSIDEAQARTGVELLDFQLRHVFALDELLPSRTDPLDRALAAQALAEGLPIVSGDAAFDQLGVERIW